MSLLSDLNDKIKALSTRVAAQFKTQQSDIDSKVADVTLSGKTLTVTKGDGTSSTYTTTDTNTTYTAGTGLSLSSNKFSLAASGATAGSYGPSANASPAHKGTFSVPYITVDDTGRVTDISTKTITLPADNNTTYSNMTAATASAAGKAGLVPAPAAGAQGKYLRGDGTWQTPPNTTYSNMTAATADAAGKAGLVPAPAAGAQGKYLRGDGTWQTPTDSTKVAKSGDTMTGPLNSSFVTSTYVKGFQGNALLASTASAGSYVTFLRYATTNGYMTVSGFQGKMECSYQDKATVDAGTNTVKYTVRLLDESGNTTISQRLVFANGSQIWVA